MSGLDLCWSAWWYIVHCCGWCWTCKLGGSHCTTICEHKLILVCWMKTNEITVGYCVNVVIAFQVHGACHHLDNSFEWFLNKQNVCLSVVFKKQSLVVTTFLHIHRSAQDVHLYHTQEGSMQVLHSCYSKGVGLCNGPHCEGVLLSLLEYWIVPCSRCVRAALCRPSRCARQCLDTGEVCPDHPCCQTLPGRRQKVGQQVSPFLLLSGQESVQSRPHEEPKLDTN